MRLSCILFCKIANNMKGNHSELSFTLGADKYDMLMNVFCLIVDLKFCNTGCKGCRDPGGPSQSA